MATDHFEDLRRILLSCEERAKDGHLALGDAIDDMGASAFPFLCIIQSIPFVQPISLGPLATAGGLGFAALGWQMMRGAEHPWLPRRLHDQALSARTWRLILETSLKVVAILRRISRPRLPGLVHSPRARAFGGFLVAFSGLLMAIPFMGLPLNNTLPAVVILMISIGELEEDGLMVILALFVLALTLGYFGLIFWVVFVLGDNAMDYLHGLWEALPAFGG